MPKCPSRKPIFRQERHARFRAATLTNEKGAWVHAYRCPFVFDHWHIGNVPAEAVANAPWYMRLWLRRLARKAEARR